MRELKYLGLSILRVFLSIKSLESKGPLSSYKALDRIIIKP